MVDLKDLGTFVVLLVVVAMLIGVGVIVMDKTATASYNDHIADTQAFTMPANNTNVTLRGPVLSFTGVKNSTGYIPSTSYVVYATAGKVLMYNSSQGCATGGSCSAVYDWRESGTKAYTALTDMSSSVISPLASTWMSLIVTIVILGIILGIVINSMSRR